MVKISELGTIGSVDGGADYIPIVDVSLPATKKVTRNGLLGLASTPLGLTDSQSPTNKTLNNTNIITARDDRFTLQDNADTTKQARFDVSPVAAATTRTYSLPDRTDTLVTLGGAQTLTDKTLTSPTINTPIITNPNLTTNSIAEHTSGSGVTIDGVLLKDSMVGDGHVVPDSLVAGSGDSWDWTSWSPGYVNVTTTTATIISRAKQMGKTVNGRWSMTHGASSDFLASATITLPATASPEYTYTIDIIGTGIAFDSSSGASVPIYAVIQSATTFRIRSIDSNAVFYNVTDLLPYNWATGDIISVNFSYEAV